MARRSIFRSSTFYFALLAGLGGITPDIGHGLNLITGGKVGWNATHGWLGVLLWVWFALTIGLFTAVVLRKKYQRH